MAEKYLMATDGERSTESLVNYITKRFKPGEPEIQVICVADESRVIPHLMAEEGGTGGIDPVQVHERLEEQAESIADEAVSLLEEKGFDATSIVRFGNPGSEICETATEEGFSEIIISRRSHTAVGELLLGSVSQYVIHHASNPVTLVPIEPE